MNSNKKYNSKKDFVYLEKNVNNSNRYKINTQLLPINQIKKLENGYTNNFIHNDFSSYKFNNFGIYSEENYNFFKTKIIFVQDSKGNQEKIEINENDNILKIKEILSDKTGVNINMILQYNRKILENYRKVYDYEIEENSVISYIGCFTEIEKEPDDISDFSSGQRCCLPLYEIKNNCNNFEWELFPKEIAANQLKQEVGNCYMVSALESISHIPFLLNYIFNTFQDTFTQFSEKYKVNFSNKSYIVLNKFPYDKVSKQLIFMKPLEKEAYAIIFEKVWAVIRKGYKNRGWTFISGF